MSHLLSSYLDGQVDEEETNRVEQHLDTCSACRAELAQLRLIVNTMRATPVPDPSRSFTLTPEMVRRRPSWLSLWSTYSPAAAAIAALLLVAVVFADFLLVSGGRGSSARLEDLTQSVMTGDPTAVLEAAAAQPAEEVALAPAPPDLDPEPAHAPAATAAAAAPSLAQEAPVEPSIGALEGFTEAPAESASGSGPVPTEALAAAPMALEAPDSSEDYPPDRRGLGSPPRPGTTEETAEEPSLPESSTASAAPEALAAEVTQDAGSAEAPESPALARSAERDSTEALERTDTAAPGAESRTVSRAIRAAEMGLALVLVVALATWGARAARGRRAP